MKFILEIIGAERILTSGQRPTAPEGAKLIRQLIHQANDKIIIMPGSGVRSDNVVDLAKHTGAVEFHASARIRVPGKMTYISPLMNETAESITVDEDELKL